jgi:hypothetical protein
MHSSTRRRATSGDGSVRRLWPGLLLPVLGLVVALAAWLGMVVGAIGAGREARDGDGGWLLVGLGTVGAVACLLLALLTGARSLRLLGIIGDHQPRRARRR